MSQLPLPLSLSQALKHVIVPALAELGPKYDTPSARVQLLAMAQQESALKYRHQVGGPAHGLWQFEMAGVRGVLNHSTSQRAARELCDLHGIAPTVSATYAAIEEDDVLAAGFARLLLWTLPDALPKVGDEAEAFAQYIEAWRPGAFTGGTVAKRQALREKWGRNYQAALAAVVGR